MYADRPWRTSSRGEARALMNLMKSANHDTRMWAAEELGKTKVLHRATVRAIIAALKVEKGPAKIMMIDSLGELSDKSAVRILAAFLSNEDRYVRAHSAVSLAIIKHAASGPVIEARLKTERSAIIRAWYLYALHLLGCGDRTAEMLRLLGARGRETRAVVSFFLQRIASVESSKEIVLSMRKALKREHPAMREYLRHAIRQVEHSR